MGQGEGAPVDEPSGDRAERRLSPRQFEVLVLLADGADTDQIAQQLFISHNTVRNHIQQVLRTLGVHSRLEAVAMAFREGIIAPPDGPGPRSDRGGTGPRG